MRNLDAAPLYWIVGGALMIPAVAGMLTPQRFEVLGVLIALVLLLGRYLLPTRCEIRGQSIIFHWPLRKVEISPESLAKAAVLPGAVETLGLRARGSVRFGIRPSRWTGSDALVESLGRLIDQAPAEAVTDPAAVRSALRRL